MQHSQSPIAAGYGAVMGHCLISGDRTCGQYCSLCKISSRYPQGTRSSLSKKANLRKTSLRGITPDEHSQCLEDAQKQFPTHDGIPFAEMIKTIIGPAIEGLPRPDDA